MIEMVKHSLNLDLSIDQSYRSMLSRQKQWRWDVFEHMNNRFSFTFTPPPATRMWEPDTDAIRGMVGMGDIEDGKGQNGLEFAALNLIQQG